jgi:transcriptional repressor NrdR
MISGCSFERFFEDFGGFMKCPACHFLETRVVDSRAIDEGMAIRRRRECDKCSFRFSTYEQLELLNLTVIKRDGRTEMYTHEKLEQGVKRALEKRPMTVERFKRLIQAMERDIQTAARQDTIPSVKIGEIVMKHLRRTDKVAYVRFSSVCKSFDNLETFQETLDQLTRKKVRKTA